MSKNVSSGVSREIVSEGLLWPNNITPYEGGTSNNSSTTFILGDGFLVPGKSTGAIHRITVDANGNAKDEKLTTDKKDWFYHKGVFVDVNGDGLKDIVTARGHKALFGGGEGELIWLQNPGNEVKIPWDEHHLADGPDIGIHVMGLF